MNLTHRSRAAGPTSRSQASGPAAALVAVLLIAGCGTSEEETASEPTTTSAESEPTGESATGSAEESATESEPAEESATESESATQTEAAAEDLVITIADFSFEVPGSIPAGSKITVVNQDGVGHTVTSDEEGLFDVFVGPGEEVGFTVPEETGEFAFHCTPHPTMTSTLVIG